LQSRGAARSVRDEAKGVAEKVIVLDDDQDLLDLFAHIVRQYCGKECLCMRSVADLVSDPARAIACDLAILDVNLGPDRPSGIDAFRWLRSQGFAGRILFLTGHGRSHPLVDEAHRLGAAGVLEKPIDLDTVLSIIEGSGRPPREGGAA
jgi:FixJ family two-component response regulator